MVRWRRTCLAEFEGIDSEGLVAARGGRYSAGAMGAEHGRNFIEPIRQSGMQRCGAGFGGEIDIGALFDQKLDHVATAHGSRYIKRRGPGFVIAGIERRTVVEQ